MPHPNETIARSFTYERGYKGYIVYDSSPQAPDHDTVGSIAYLASSRYTLGNEPVSHERMNEIRDGLASGDLVGLPVYAYIHGNATIRAGAAYTCPWDSGQSGFVYCTKERAIEECLSVENALKAMTDEVEVFAAYLEGEVFGYVVENADGDSVDSCWGYYGDREFQHMQEEIEDSVRWHIEADKLLEESQARAAEAEAAERQHWAERDVITA